MREYVRGPSVYMRPASSPSSLGDGPSTRTLTKTCGRTWFPTLPRVMSFATCVVTLVLRLPWRFGILYSLSPESHPSFSHSPLSAAAFTLEFTPRFGSGKRRTVLPSRSSWLPGSSSSRRSVSTNPNAGIPATIQRASKTGSSVLRMVAVRNDIDSLCEWGGSGEPVTGGMGERVAWR